MKVSRRKKVNRYMTFFKNHFGFREPYQLLIDGPFCLAALQNQISIKDQMKSYFNCEVKLLTTLCVQLELERLGPPLYGALKILKQFPVHKCGHEKAPVPASQCLQSMLAETNPDRYVIVSQDPSMREAARLVPGTPILYLYGRAPTLEKPSDYSKSLVNEDAEQRLASEEERIERLRQLKARELGERPAVEQRPRKKKAKGPNPLSCQKKKKKPQATAVAAGGKRPAGDSAEAAVAKKKRKRVKVAAHVRQELQRRQQPTASPSS